VWPRRQSFFILPGTEVYARMGELAARHGTEIRHPFWWRERREQHALATDVLPSAAWAGREEELLDFQRWQRELNRSWIERYPIDVHLYRSAFHGGGGAAPPAETRTTRQAPRTVFSAWPTPSIRASPPNATRAGRPNPRRRRHPEGESRLEAGFLAVACVICNSIEHASIQTG
jgi:hypothetical protein